ncbi:MAG: TolC family protein [Halomonadaceae bacterium]|nr:MAG: TolC family protein [Halomonadaceae bacterium]
MMTPNTRRHCAGLVLLLLANPGFAVQPLTLQEVEQLAIRDPGIERFQHLANSYEEEAVAARQLPDPQLSAEIMQFPLDRPGFNRDPMTAVQLGVRQSFPRGSSRQISGERNQTLALAQREQGHAYQLEVVREARTAYLQLMLEQQRLVVLETSRGVFSNLAEVSRRTFASGLVSQQDVLRAELELERLEDRINEAEGQRAAARASLARWIGPAAQRPLQSDFPPLPQWQGADLNEHPLLAASQAQIQAGEQAVELAEQDYKAQWGVQVGYGIRTSSEARNPHRLSAMVTVDLPLFTGNRQDRRLAARQSDREAAVLARDERLLELRRQAEALSAQWQRLQSRETRYRERLLEVAEANAESAESAYSAGTVEFTALMEARLLALETRLESLRITAERKQVQAQLLYLLGEDQS